MKTFTAHRYWWAFWTVFCTFWSVYLLAVALEWIIGLAEDHSLPALTTITVNLGCVAALMILAFRYGDRYVAAFQRGR